MFIGLSTLHLCKAQVPGAPPFNPSSVAALTGWADPSNFATMQQSSVSGGAVTATGQLVGKITSAAPATAIWSDTDANRRILQQDAGGHFNLSVNTFVNIDSGGGSTTAFFLIAALQITGGFVNYIYSEHTAAAPNTGYDLFYDGNVDHMKFSAGNGTARTTAESLTAVGGLSGPVHVVMAWDDGVNLNVQLDNGTVASVARPTVSAGSLTPTWYAEDTVPTNTNAALDYGALFAKNSALTAQQRANIKTWLGAKAGLSL